MTKIVLAAGGLLLLGLIFGLVYSQCSAKNSADDEDLSFDEQASLEYSRVAKSGQVNAVEEAKELKGFKAY